MHINAWAASKKARTSIIYRTIANTSSNREDETRETGATAAIGRELTTQQTAMQTRIMPTTKQLPEFIINMSLANGAVLSCAVLSCATTD